MRRALALLALLGVSVATAIGLTGRESAAPRLAELTGDARVLDGDTIVLAGQRVRLHGLDAPEPGQTCTREGSPWRCGEEATRALQGFLAGRLVRCLAHDTDRFGRLLARCRVGEDDIGAWLVSQGLAVAYTRYSWRYLPEELGARWHGRGLWAGDFETPEAWRRRNLR